MSDNSADGVVSKQLGPTTIESGQEASATLVADPTSEFDVATTTIDSEQDLLALLLPSYLLTIAIFAGLIAAAGIWEVVANTRVLAFLLAGGVVALGEDDPGLGSGVPGIHYFIRSQEPIIWQLLLISAAMFVAITLLKGLQFHRLARHVGIQGSVGQHLRVYIYGHALGRMLPFRFEEFAWATALQGQGGVSAGQSARLVFLFKGFLLFEIATFAVIGLIMAGLLNWALALAPPIVILVIAHLLLPQGRADGIALSSRFDLAGDEISGLANKPQMFIGLVLISLLSFTLVEFATYLIPQAFSTVTVPLVKDVLRVVVVTPPVIVMAVVSGYLARLIPITPGGIGQFELAFVMVLYLNNLPITEAVCLTLLVSGVRYLTGIILFGLTMVLFGVETNFQQVRNLLSRA